MIFVAIVISAVLIYFLQARLYTKHAYDKLDYSVRVSVREVFENEEIYLYEEISNNKFLPLPFLKVDTELPEGLSFHIIEKDEKTGIMNDTYPRVIHSIFVLKGHQMVSRRWRIRCDTRGTYDLGKVTILSDNILGSQLNAKVIIPEPSEKANLVVLPKAIDLEKHFTSTRYINGEFSVSNSIVSDPLIKSGVREYAVGDPLNRINWKQTAAKGRLMTNVEEYTNRHQFNIIFNMQSRDIEKIIPGPPSSTVPVELCMTVIASILDAVSSENVPVKLISNTDPGFVGEKMSISDDEYGSKIFLSREYRGKNDMIAALRLLAQMKLMISLPVEKMLDYIVERPYIFANGGNIIFVSSYLSERMINFCYLLRKEGIHVIFYITSASINAEIIPEDIEVHYRTFQ